MPRWCSPPAPVSAPLDAVGRPGGTPPSFGRHSTASTEQPAHPGLWPPSIYTPDAAPRCTIPRPCRQLCNAWLHPTAYLPTAGPSPGPGPAPAGNANFSLYFHPSPKDTSLVAIREPLMLTCGAAKTALHIK
jgi:hypothetical protein